MAYEDTIPEKIRSMGQRVDERLALWQAITRSFEAEGAGGIEDELAARMREVRKRFKVVLDKLEAML